MEIHNEKILIVESEPIIRKVIVTRLTILGYKIFLASNGKDALTIFKNERPHLVILSIVLPKLDGYEVCYKIRRTSQVPIIILTGLQKISDRIKALDLGADDCIVKPFSPKELETKIKSILTRFYTQKKVYTENKQNIFQIGKLIIDLNTRKVLKNNMKIELTEIEFNIFLILLINAGKSLSRTQLLDNVWGYRPERAVDTRIIDVHVSRLRSKIENDPSNPDLIVTVRGTGYKFQAY